MHVVSLSTGKDSVATLLLALETQPRDRVQAVFADTGNEHEAVYEHLAYIEDKLKLQVTRLRRDFKNWWWQRRQYIAEHWAKPAPKKGWPEGVPQATIENVLRVFDRGPTGNPYLDLCIIKGRFPTRTTQFCTQFLKTEPIVEHQLELLEQGWAVWSWQGVRRDESAARANAKEFEALHEDYVAAPVFAYRPIVRWTAQDTIDSHHVCGIEPNPLYKQGMGRVGCMPCINANKDEILEIARRFPQHIDRIEEWEAIAGAASKRGRTTYFPAPEDGRADITGRNIREVVRWSTTARGGRQFGLFRTTEQPAGEQCKSSYGLCEGR